MAAALLLIITTDQDQEVTIEVCQDHITVVQPEMLADLADLELPILMDKQDKVMHLIIMQVDQLVINNLDHQMRLEDMPLLKDHKEADQPEMNLIHLHKEPKLADHLTHLHHHQVVADQWAAEAAVAQDHQEQEEVNL